MNKMLQDLTVQHGISYQDSYRAIGNLFWYFAVLKVTSLKIISENVL